MLEAWIDIMLWDGVALIAFVGILSCGLLRYGSVKTTILPAACIPIASAILDLGYYLWWWDHTGFMGLTMTILLGAATVGLLLLFGVDSRNTNQEGKQ